MKNKNSASFFTNSDCPYFPCHKVEKQENFNCLFCYCPLYNISDCGGNFKILKNGIKDCSDCTIPHNEKSYDYITKKLAKYNENLHTT